MVVNGEACRRPYFHSKFGCSFSQILDSRVIGSERAKRVQTRFEDLLERHEKEIYRFACRMTGNRDDALRYYDRALEIRPDYPRALRNREIAAQLP